MNEDQLKELAQKIAPHIAQELTRIPTFYGDRARLTCGHGVKLINTFFNLSSGCVKIGDHTFFGNNVTILTGTHDISKTLDERKKHPKKGNDIIIGNGVWIASGAVIIGPCEIGDNSVIAAGSILLPGKYDADCLYAGIPAKFKKKINFT
jgi:acetyltransferase-like isoleucine patch superfamily enzyme